MDALELSPFSRLPDDVARRLLAGTETLGYRTGKVLFYQGDRADHAWLLLSGTIRSVMYRSDETSLDLGLLGPGDWLGLPEMLLNGPYLGDAVVMESSRVLGFGQLAFGRLRQNASCAEWLLAELARQQYTLHARVELAQPGQRVARWLLGRCGDGRSPIHCTQDELGQAIGLSRETVNRHLGRLQLDGLVSLGRGCVTVLDPAALAAWAGE